MTRPGPENSLFVITVLLAWTLMHLYAFWRISSVPLVARRLPRWLLIAVAAFLWISFLPRLTELGVTESDIGSMLVDAPRRLLAGA